MAIYKRENVWYIDYYYNGKRIRKRSNAVSHRLAEIELGEIQKEIEEDKHTIKRQKKILFEDMAKEYIESYSKPNKKSWWRDEISLKHLIDFFKGIYLHNITAHLIENYKNKRINNKINIATINRELSCLR